MDEIVKSELLAPKHAAGTLISAIYCRWTTAKLNAES